MKALIKNFFKSFVSFRFSILTGLGMALWLDSVQTETQPLIDFLTGSQIYLIAFLIIFGFRFTLWIVIEKGAFYNLKHTLGTIVIDYITCIISILSASSCLFLIKTFILS